MNSHGWVGQTRPLDLTRLFQSSSTQGHRDPEALWTVQDLVDAWLSLDTKNVNYFFL